MRRRRRKALTFWDDIVRQQRATKRQRFETSTFPMMTTNPNTSPQSSALDPVVADPKPNISTDSMEQNSNHFQHTVAEGASAINEIEPHNPRPGTHPAEEDLPDDIRISNDFDDDASEVRYLREALDDGNEFQPFDEGEDYATSAMTIREAIPPTMTESPSRGTCSRSKDPDLDLIQDRLSEWEEDLSLTALIAVVGSVRFTVEQYNFTRDILAECSAGENFPPYSKTQQRFQSLIKHCLPSSAIVRVPKKSSTASNHFDLAPQINPDSRNISIQEGEEIRVFLPSSWAKLDITTSITFDRMFPGYPDFSPGKSSLEYSTIVQRRDEITNACEHIYALHDNEITPCQIGDVLRIMTEGQMPALGPQYDISSSDDFHKFFAKIAGTWCVGSENAATNSFRRLLNVSSLSDYEKRIIQCLSTGLSPHHVSETAIPIHPGDLCTLLTPVQGESSSFPILIHTFWRHEDGIPSSSLICLRLQSEAQQDSEPTSQVVEMLSKSIVRRSTLWERHADFHAPNSDVNRSMGKLSDGTPYVVYRILLYCDDFQKSSAMYPKGSAGGCYFLPISLPPEDRRSKSSVRIISLTPPEVSTNDVLQYIASDLVSAAVHGVDTTTPLGEYVKVFIDPVAFVGDYPASAETIDVIGHVARAPCTLCTFRRLHETETSGSRFGYTTEVHSRNSAFIRHNDRQRSLRNASLPDPDARRLGMIVSKKTSDRRCPLLHLQRSLEENMSRAALTKDGAPAVSCLFDAYRSNLIAPDHLLSGLSKNVLNAVFLSLPTDALRDKADICICDALRQNGLLPQKEVFNRRTNSIHSMTLSEIFCVLSASVPVMGMITRDIADGDVARDCVKLLCKLQKLIALTNWWPQKEIDGINAEKIVRQTKHTYLSDLRSMSKDYVKLVDEVCSRSPQSKQHLDKPNLHRLLELYEHTIPAFGHVREITELVFESAHQPLKRCIARSNNRMSHLFAVEHCVANDWQGRLAALQEYLSPPYPESIPNSGDSSETSNYISGATRLGAMRTLRRLLIGEQADLLDEKTHVDIIRTIDETLKKQFKQAVMKRFQKDGMISNFTTTKRSLWKGRGKTCIPKTSTDSGICQSHIQNMVKLSRRWINALLPSMDQGETTEEIALYRYARRVRIGKGGRQIGKPPPHDSISINSAVQIHLDPGTLETIILKSSPDSPGTRPYIFVVLAVLQRKNDIPFAIAFRCVKRGDVLLRRELQNGSFKLLILTDDVRRVGVYHACDKDQRENMRCAVDTETKKVIHHTTLLNGGKMYFQCRPNGYPPRMA